MTDDRMVGSTVHIGSRKARIAVCSELLDIALLEYLDENDQPTRQHALAKPSKMAPRPEELTA